MCGRFTFAMDDWPGVYDYFGVVDRGFRSPPQYNIAPSSSVVAVISDAEQRRRLGFLRWGLIPHGSGTGKPRYSTFNARVETINVAPTFRTLIYHNRCIIATDGFYEWHKDSRKPYRIRVAKQEVFGFAGLYDTWIASNGKRLHTCTILTCPPNSFMEPYHDRMPVILNRGAQDVWLNRSEQDIAALMDLLKPYAGEMYAYRVSERVGNVRNTGPECVEQIR